MRANAAFHSETISFWAYVRAISEALGYSTRGSGRVGTFSLPEMTRALDLLQRPSESLGTPQRPTDFAKQLQSYFDYRAVVLNDHVRKDLMVAQEAASTFNEVRRMVKAVPLGEVTNSSGRVSSVEYRVGPSVVRIPLNKQSGDKRAVSYLTGIVNLLVAHTLKGAPCDYDPRKLPVIDHDGVLYAALSRRMDGSFPSTSNPIAMWEIKEYYYTTTFGSKISDAVYISSLDGYERLEVERATGIKIEHVIMVDAFDTWWGMGKSYLCRMVDILNMGHVDEILFGREVVRRIPELAAEWLSKSEPIPSSSALRLPLSEDR